MTKRLADAKRAIERSQQARLATLDASLRDVDNQSLLEGSIRAVRTFGIPNWKKEYPKDIRPEKALEAAEMCMRRHPNGIMFARAASKACTAARQASLGCHHGVAESAREIALCAVKVTESERRESAYEALALLRDYLMYRLSIDGIYGKDDEVTAQIVAAVIGPRSNS